MLIYFPSTRAAGSQDLRSSAIIPPASRPAPRRATLCSAVWRRQYPLRRCWSPAAASGRCTPPPAPSRGNHRRATPHTCTRHKVNADTTATQSCARVASRCPRHKQTAWEGMVAAHEVDVYPRHDEHVALAKHVLRNVTPDSSTKPYRTAPAGAPRGTSARTQRRC